MSPVGDIYSGTWSQIQSNLGKPAPRDSMLWQSLSTSGADHFPGAFPATSTPYTIPQMAIPVLDFADGSTAMATSFPETHQTQYPFTMDMYHWNLEAAQPMFEDNYLAFETASSNGSYAPSLVDVEHLAASPTSPTFSAVVSIGAASDARSILLSPDVRPEDQFQHVLPIQSPVMDNDNDAVSGHEESDDLLDALLKDISPGRDGKYHCKDVEAEDHECDYAADRKCMLRYKSSPRGDYKYSTDSCKHRKHLESTLKTNVCHHKDCKGMQFSSKAVLTRHEKEAHGMHAAHQFFCPVRTCDRHGRGFPREYNMGDHIQRVHRDLDVNDYLKKNKRSRKHSASSNNTVASARSVMTGVSHSSGVRKSSGSRARREKLEKQYRQSREQIGQLIFKLPEQSTASAQKCVEQMKAELETLENAIAVLHAAVND